MKAKYLFNVLLASMMLAEMTFMGCSTDDNPVEDNRPTPPTA